MPSFIDASQATCNNAAPRSLQSRLSARNISSTSLLVIAVSSSTSTHLRRLVSVPEMSYLVSDTVHDRQEENGIVVNQGVPCQGRGEICIKGHNIFAGALQWIRNHLEYLADDDSVC